MRQGGMNGEQRCRMLDREAGYKWMTNDIWAIEKEEENAHKQSWQLSLSITLHHVFSIMDSET